MVKIESHSAAPSMRFLPLQRIPAQGSGMMVKIPTLTASAFRYSQPLGAFIRPEPAGLISCQIRSWGPLQSFAPPSLPYTVSSAFTLLTFERLQGVAQFGSPLLDKAV